jgi:transcriptional regulator with XRE-family HTH domain
MASGTGRPTRYSTTHDQQAAVACRLGATDKDLAELFGVTETTINNWKNKHPGFKAALSNSKEMANYNVEQALYKRALGATIKEDKIFNNGGEALIVPTLKEFPPDTAACIAWLSNRDPERWKRDPGGAAETAEKISEQLEKLMGGLPD